MNEIIKAITERRSVRKYLSRPVPKAIIEEIVNAGTYAANGRGMQSAIIIAVTNRELRDKLSAANCKIGGWSDDQGNSIYFFRKQW